jgi:hypothetical protein
MKKTENMKSIKYKKNARKNTRKNRGGENANTADLNTLKRDATFHIELSRTEKLRSDHLKLKISELILDESSHSHSHSHSSQNTKKINNLLIDAFHIIGQFNSHKTKLNEILDKVNKFGFNRTFIKDILLEFEHLFKDVKNNVKEMLTKSNRNHDDYEYLANHFYDSHFFDSPGQN